MVVLVEAAAGAGKFMEVKFLNEKEPWENFLLTQTTSTFLQSWNWGTFQESLGRKVFRLGLFGGNKLDGLALLIKVQTGFGTYLYCPRGPIVDWGTKESLTHITQKAAEIAKEEKVDFVKFEPLLLESPENEAKFASLGFKRAVTFVQVEDAWILNITKPEEQLLAEMRKTTRYLVRQEEKQGASVSVSDSVEDIKGFADMLLKTADRKNFVNHQKEYYIKQFEIFAPENQMRLFKSMRDGQVQAAAVVAYYGDTAYYLHGASVQGVGSVGYLVQWEAIKEAKRRGCKYYNFWGVAKDKHFHPGHPWYGFSLFKRGFGGEKTTYIRAQDLPITPKYWLYRGTEIGRRLYKRVREGYVED